MANSFVLTLKSLALSTTITILVVACKDPGQADPTANPDTTVSTDSARDPLDLSGKVVGWREDNRTGVSAETGLLKSWPEGGPKFVWSNTELPEGHSSVAIGHNSLFLTGIQSENDVLVSLDNRGNIKWQTPYGRSWDGSYPESRCTPTIDGDKVFVSSGMGDLACVDAITGNMVWQSKASEKFKGTNGKWGIAESLLVDSSNVYFSPGGPETMTIALNKSTGELVWKSSSLNDKTGYVSPILVNYAGKNMLINASLGHVFAVDTKNGEILWSVGYTSEAMWGDHIVCATPIFKDGMVYVSEGYNAGGIMIRIAANGKSAKTLWTDEVLDNHVGGVVLVDGFIYGSNWTSNGDGDWCCIDWKTGKVSYQVDWKSKGSIIAADGMLYLYDEKSGNVALVKPNPSTFDLVSSFKVSEGSGPYWSHPVIHNGYLFIRHGKALMVYNIRNVQ
jgi:outer membrane protein assembly factor BamB